MATDLSFNIIAKSGYNHLRRTVYSSNKVFSAESQGQSQEEIAGKATLTLPENIDVLFIETSGPLEVEGTDAENASAFAINKVFLSDHSWEEISLYNDSDAPVTVRIIWSKNEVI